MQVGMVDRQAIRRRWEAVGSKLDERGRRMFAAGEALVAGWGGLEAVSEITGLARSTLARGTKKTPTLPRCRKAGSAAMVLADLIFRAGTPRSSRICSA